MASHEVTWAAVERADLVKENQISAEFRSSHVSSLNVRAARPKEDAETVVQATRIRKPDQRTGQYVEHEQSHVSRRAS